MPINPRITGTYESFGSRLVRLRKAKNMTSADIARAAEVTPTAVWNWENGNTEPRYFTLIKLADALGVSADYLKEGDDASDGDELSTEKEQVVGLPEILEDARRKIAAQMGLEARSIKLLVQFHA
jgi:transcriptional regulator with XRE-family HTH domain